MEPLNGEMGDGFDTNEPNRMSEIYRKFQPTPIPLQIEKHLNFIEIADDGCMLLGSSTLNGRFWTGSLHYFNEPTTNVTKDTCLTGMNCQTVITAGKFINSKDKVVIGEDSGCLSLLSLADIEDEGLMSTHVIINIASYDHDSAVLSLSISPDKTNFVSGSMDKCIKVWNTQDLITQYTFRPAHSHLVSSVDYSPFNNSVFGSCSLDGFALTWDIRLEKPATVVKKSDGEGLTSVVWHPKDDNVLCIGSNYGSVSVYDVRSLKVLGSTECFHRSIHKLIYNSDGYIAACGDTNEIKVLEFKNNQFNTLYTDDRHDYYVRGIAWNSLNACDLLSCGWDAQVLQHNLENKLNNSIS